MWSQEIQLGRHNQRNRGDPRSLIRGLSGWSWWGFHKTPDKNGDSLILHRLGVSIRASEEMTSSQVECRPTNTWIVCDLIPNTFAVAIILIKLRDLTHPQMIPEQPLSINCQHYIQHPALSANMGKKVSTKNLTLVWFVYIIQYSPAPWPSLFYPITKHLNAHKSDTQCEGRSQCEHVM